MEIAPEIASYLESLSPDERAKIPASVIHPALASNHVEPDPNVKAEMDFPEDHSFNQPLSIDDLVVSHRTPTVVGAHLEGANLGDVLDAADSNEPVENDEPEADVTFGEPEDDES